MNGNDKEKKSFRVSTKLKIIITSVAAVVLILILFSAKKTEKPVFFYHPEKSAAAVLYGKKLSSEAPSGKSVARISRSAEGDTCAVLMSEGASYSLYAVSRSKVFEASDSSTNNFVISRDGSRIVFVSADGYLYSCDTSDGKTRKIDENAGGFAVSPDGKTVLYTKKEGNVSQLHLFSGKKSEYIADNYVPVAVSDNRELIYVLSADSSLYLIDTEGAVKSKLCSGAQTTGLCVSRDVKSIVFSDGSYTYISVEGGSRARLAKGVCVPAGIYEESSVCTSGITVYISGEKNLTGCVYQSVSKDNSLSLYGIDNNFVRTDIATGVRDYAQTDTGLVYLSSDGRIYLSKNEQTREIIPSATEMTVTSDGKYIYYKTSDRKLYVYRNGTSELLADGVAEMCIAANGRMFFIMTDGTMYSVRGKNRSDLLDTDVYSCRCEGDYVYYSKNYSMQTGTFELYASSGSVNFDFITDGVANC